MCYIGVRCAGPTSPFKILPLAPIESIRRYWCSIHVSVVDYPYLPEDYEKTDLY